MGYKNGDSPSKVRKVAFTELAINEQHDLLSKSGDVFGNSANFSLAYTFSIYSLWEGKLDLKGQDVYRYYVNPDHRDIIQGHCVVDTLNKGNKVRFIALQGNTRAKLRLPNDHVWYDALEIAYAENATTTVPIELKWDVKGANELTLFPLRQDNKDFYSGGNLGIIRMCILNEPIDFTRYHNNIVFDEQGVNSSPSLFPIPSLTDQDGAEPKLNIQDDAVRVLKPYNSITLKEICFETKLDALLLDEEGKVEILQAGVRTIPNKKTRIALPDTLLDRIQKAQTRHFVLFLNNRGEELLTDLKAFADGKNPFPASFSLILELYKVRGE